VQRAKNLAAHHSGFGCCLRPLADALGIDLYERIQLRIQTLDFCEVRVGEFYRRNLSPANLTAHFDGG
jgi:hypothetical protein